MGAVIKAASQEKQASIQSISRSSSYLRNHKRRIMKTTAIIVLAFVAMVMLAEPTSALPKRDEANRCPNWVCQNENFLKNCGSIPDKDLNAVSLHYVFNCCPAIVSNGCK